jgi:acyl-CoA synthetase (AMP-forming)/AMP-acid ligase II
MCARFHEFRGEMDTSILTSLGIKINYSILVLAIIGAGGIYTGSNPAYTSTELKHHIKASESKFIISEPEILKPLLEAANQSGVPKKNVWIFDNLGQSIPGGTKSWKELLKFGEEDWVRFENLKTAQTTTAARLFSSGTTGLPKAVMITHYNLIAQHELVVGGDPRPYPVSPPGPTSTSSHIPNRMNSTKSAIAYYLLFRYRESLPSQYSMHRQPLSRIYLY